MFGADVNSKGFKDIRGAGVIQGDGIDIVTLEAILAAVLEDGYSAANVAFGMGGGLLQKVGGRAAGAEHSRAHTCMRAQK